ncbi:MAG TPA: hypothetical protein VFV71_13365 [Burkholderiales bacterium]|nr:hypothetical protein [Burkholderiales bacterium]
MLRRGVTGRTAAAAMLAAAGCIAAAPALAFVYPEHRDIALLAVGKLDAQRRADFDKLWAEARAGHEKRLCGQGADAQQGVAPECIDWAALAAIAGDHSCSARGLEDTVLQSDWILAVADVAAQLKADLSRIDVLPPVEQVPGSKDAIVDLKRRIQSEKARADRINALRASDIRLQRADPEYATRAGSNNAHFLLARPHTGTTLDEYARLTLLAGSELSAVGVYVWYHLSALQQAARLAQGSLQPDERRVLIRSMLFDEAFALHFLEDAFASGHVAGTWGDTSQRKGTHDAYNESGLEAFPWSGNGSMVLMGDAHMRQEDAERAAASVRQSLEQVLDAAMGRGGPHALPPIAAASDGPDGFDTCRNDVLPKRKEPEIGDPAYRKTFLAGLGDVLQPTPVPGLGPGLGAMPRSRSELGAFIGLAGSFDARGVKGGFSTPGGNGAVLGVELAARVGVGLDGVMSEAGDGLVFASVGLRGDASSTNSVGGSAAGQGGSITAAIPARTALSVRLRMPFYLVPGDLLLLSPMYLFAPQRYEAMAVTAGNGGLIPWQSGWATPFGRFQFVLGRELGASFYGLMGDDRLVVPEAPSRIVDYKSVQLDFPILEYRPYRSFAANQSSTLLFQLFTAVDIPYSDNVVAPAGAPGADLRPVWSVGLRLVFDWRYYP